MSTENQYYNYNPEKRNIFIEIHQGRTNHAIDFFIGLFMTFASHASAIVEVFLRRKFGERYITLAQSISLFFVLNISGLWLANIFNLGGGAILTLFLFSFAFLGFSIFHRIEISKYGTTYDFKRFSLSDGEIAPFWWNKVIGKEILGIKISNYHVQTLLEPAVPVIVGIVLLPLGFTRPVGLLLFICGIIFGIRNFSKAQQGRNWVLDNIDKKITSEMKYDVFIGRKPKKDTKGVYLPIELPEDEEIRKSLYSIVEDSFGKSDEIWANDYLDDNREDYDKLVNSSGGAGNG